MHTIQKKITDSFKRKEIGVLCVVRGFSGYYTFGADMPSWQPNTIEPVYTGTMPLQLWCDERQV